MSHDCHNDPILKLVSRLPEVTPDNQRADRVRAQCRAKLAPPARKHERLMGPALLAGFCLLYLSAIVHDVLQLRGML